MLPDTGGAGSFNHPTEFTMEAEVMRKTVLASAAALCLTAVVLFAACTANDGAGALRAGGSPTIPELQKMLENNEAIIVDVRDETTYKNGHIKGALSIPNSELFNRLSELPKDKQIVFYCA